MRKKNQEIKDKAKIEDILQSSIICRIAMTDGNRPYLLPFNYGYKENCIYIHSAKKGKKLDILRKNNYVCFEIEQEPKIITGETACDWTTEYRSIVGYGNIDIIDDTEEKKKALKILMEQHGAPELNTFEEKDLKRMMILKLKISEMTAKQSSSYIKPKEEN